MKRKESAEYAYIELQDKLPQFECENVWGGYTIITGSKGCFAFLGASDTNPYLEKGDAAKIEAWAKQVKKIGVHVLRMPAPEGKP